MEKGRYIEGLVCLARFRCVLQDETELLPVEPISLPLLLGEGAWIASSELNTYIVRLSANWLQVAQS